MKALKLNRVAEGILDEDAKPALDQQRASINREALEPAVKERLRVVLQNVAGINAHGRFLLACEHAACGRHREALAIIDSVVMEDPNSFGAWSIKARCHEALEQANEAIAAYGTAIALRPNNSHAYVSRACVQYEQRIHLDQARQDLDQALRLQPGMLEALINRGLVLFAMRKFDEAKADLDQALQNPDAPTRVWFIRSHVRNELNDVEGAKRDREHGLKAVPAEALSWVARGMVKLSDNAEGALSDFKKAEEAAPRCIEALHNQAYVYGAKLKQPAEALTVVDRLLTIYPDNERAKGYRATLLARLGRTDEAAAAARTLARETTKPEHIYRAACALSLASVKQPVLKTESIRLLANALVGGWGRDTLDTDADLNPIRETPEFKHFASFNRYLRAMKLPGVTP